MKLNEYESYVPEEFRATTLKSGFLFGTKGRLCVIKPEHGKLARKTEGHILIVGGPGSGKSACVAIPALRTWKSPAFVIDIKGELYQHSIRYRKHREYARVFDPLINNSYGYDPFVSLKSNPVHEARAIAQAIIPLTPDNERNSFWINNAQNLLTAAILHYYSEGKSFFDTLRLIQNFAGRRLLSIINKSKDENARLIIQGLVDTDDRTLANLTATLTTDISALVTDRTIAKMLTGENIHPADLENYHDIYVRIPEYFLNMPQWNKFLSLMVSQFLRFFEKRSEKNNHPILFLIDEFPRLGKFPEIANGLATLRGKNIVICPIIQSISQLKKIYGQYEADVILDNCSFKAVLSVSTAESQDMFSKLFGTEEREKVSHSRNFSSFFMFGFGQSTTTEEKRKFKPEDFALLPKYEKIMLFTPCGSFLVEKRGYWEYGN